MTASAVEPEMGEEPPTEPRARFVYDFGWGDLKDHWQECEDCNGTGKDEADGSGPPDDCGCCNGDGRSRWGSFYEQDIGECPHCEAQDVRIAEMYEDSGSCWNTSWICLPCYVEHHREACKCVLWADAEKALDALPRDEPSAEKSTRPEGEP